MKASIIKTKTAVLIILMTYVNVSAQEGGGGSSFAPLLRDAQIAYKVQPRNSDFDDQFQTTVYTFNDVTLFSYFDNTDFTVTDSFDNEVYTGTLNVGEQETINLVSGIYRIYANKSFTSLVGDAVSGDINGFFATDQGGKGVSTLLNTYMVNRGMGGEKFIVFAYAENTAFTIRELESGEILYAGLLNEGEHYELPNPPHGTFLQVSSSKPVSALSYGDQDFYVPAKNGSFSGTTFYGFSGYIGRWTNSITVTAYHDETNIEVVNTETEEVIDTFELGAGQVKSLAVRTDTYWKVTASSTVTVANIPYVGWTGNYRYMTRAIDESGAGAGTLFYVPTIASRVDIFSFVDDNRIKVTRLGRDEDYPYDDASLVSVPGVDHDVDGFFVLNTGEVATINTLTGRYVYKVESSESVSVLQSNGGWGADFMPLNYAESLPDVSVSSVDISFSPEKDVYATGEEVLVRSVHKTT